MATTLESTPTDEVKGEHEFAGWTAFVDVNGLDPVSAALVEVINREMIMPFSPAWTELMDGPFVLWLESRHSGTALTIIEGPNFEIVAGEFYGTYQDRDRDRAWRRSSERRMTRRECEHMVGVMDDALYVTIEKAKKQHAWSAEILSALDDLQLRYTFVRDYLFGDLGAEFILACAVAFRHVETNNHLRRRLLRRSSTANFALERDRWWI